MFDTLGRFADPIKTLPARLLYGFAKLSVCQKIWLSLAA